MYFLRINVECMTQLVIFDLDGTLLDTIEDLANSVNFALKKNGFQLHAVETYRRFVGNGVTKLIERALPDDKKNAETIERVKKDFILHYIPHSEDYTRPYTGIPELLAALHQKGIQLAVASNKVHEATERIIKHFFPDIPFSVVLGQQEGIPVKPDPAIMLSILKQTAIPKEAVLYVGDSGVDVLTARNADLPFVAVLWGFRPKEELEAKGAVRFVQSPDEILKLISY
jgi:phosphoglycolate phosphatase